MTRSIERKPIMRFAVPIALLLLALPGLAQNEPADAQAPKSDPAALAILDTAISHQAPAEVAREGGIRSLYVNIAASVYQDPERPKKYVDLRVRRWLQMEPLRFRSEWLTDAEKLVKGYDGRRYWFAEYDDSGDLQGEAYPLKGDKYASDRQQLVDEIDETRHLLRLFILANLKTADAVFTKLPDAAVDYRPWKKKRDCRVIRRTTADTGRPGRTLTLWIDAKDHTLVKAEAEPRDPAGRILTFYFRVSEAVQPRVGGVLFPYMVHTWERSPGSPIQEARLTSRARLPREEGKPSIAFNLPEKDLPDELFRMPRE
jgi:hypothetical protein